jgi:hypothetical protein
MKKWLAIPVIALLGWVAAGPFMTIHSIREAIQAEDTSALAEHVDFPILRQNLRAQLEDYLARQAGNGFQDNAFGALALGLANRAAAGAVDAVATPAGIGAVLQGRGLLHRITGGGIRDDDTFAHAPPPDPLGDARYRFESPSRFTATVRNDDGDPVIFVLHRQGLRWKLDDIRLPLGDAAMATD